MTRLILAPAIVFAMAASAVAADDAKVLDGKWTVTAITRDGKPDKSLDGAVREHADGKYSVTPAAGSNAVKVEGAAVIDGAKKTIDMNPSAGRYKDKTLQGIFKLDGDTLTIAFAEPGKDRPTTFESKEGSGVVVAVHTKVK